MKKYKYIGVLGLCLAAGFTSCSLDEEPDSYYAQNNYFNNEDNAKMSVIGAYDCLSTKNHYGQFEMAMPASDDTYYIKGTNTDNTRRDIAHYTVTVTNQWVNTLWQNKYLGIDRANFAITGIEGMEGYAENAKLKNYVAQAKFLRAFLAFDLVKYWGDVPFKTTYTGSFADAFGPRVSREVIYDQIIEDLNFAKENLSVPSASVSPEVPSQSAASALLMRVYLQRAGFSLQADGKMTRPDDATRTTYFKAVIAEWEKIKNNGYNGLLEEVEGENGYLRLFKNFSAGVLDSKESLWEVAFNPSGENFGEDCGNWATYNGPAVAEPKGADKTKVMGRANAFFRVVPTWQNYFEDTDARRNVMVVDYEFKWKDGAHVKTSNASKPENWCPGKWRREWMPLGYIDPNNTGVNYCALRYADAILMAAEAYNETGNSAEAWSLINQVRQRAGATPVSAANYSTYYKDKVLTLPFIDDATEQGKVRTALYWERAFELAFEGQRKYDLIRWNCLKEALVLFRAQQTPKVQEGYIAGEKFQSGKHELFPIPLDEIQANAKLEGKNNPGY